MTKYFATIAHHSIASAAVVEIEGTLVQAKRTATKEFGDGFIDHRIVIRNERGETVASRRIGDKRWN